MRKLLANTFLFVICPTAILLGNWILADNASRPGETGVVALDLNTVSLAGGLEAAIADSRQDLVMLYHPHCPCTKSSLRNLERLTSLFVQKPRVWAVAYCPSTEPDSWVNSVSTTNLIEITDATLVIDHEGKLATAFGAETSGHVMLYNTAGQLTFSGGITPGRGHEGGCHALNDLLKRINQESKDASFWPVHGCPIVRQEVTES